MKFMEILVSQGGSQIKSSSVRSFDLTRPGVAPPMLKAFWCISDSENAPRDNIFSHISGGGGWTRNPPPLKYGPDQ